MEKVLVVLLFVVCAAQTQTDFYSTVIQYKNSDCSGNVLAITCTLNAFVCADQPCSSGFRTFCNKTLPAFPKGHIVFQSFSTLSCSGSKPVSVSSLAPGICLEPLPTLPMSMQYDLVNSGAGFRNRQWPLAARCAGTPTLDVTSPLGCSAQGASQSQLAYVSNAASFLVAWSALTSFAYFFL